MALWGLPWAWPATVIYDHIWYHLVQYLSLVNFIQNPKCQPNNRALRGRMGSVKCFLLERTHDPKWLSQSPWANTILITFPSMQQWQQAIQFLITAPWLNNRRFIRNQRVGIFWMWHQSSICRPNLDGQRSRSTYTIHVKGFFMSNSCHLWLNVASVNSKHLLHVSSNALQWQYQKIYVTFSLPHTNSSQVWIIRFPGPTITLHLCLLKTSHPYTVRLPTANPRQQKLRRQPNTPTLVQ